MHAEDISSACMETGMSATVRQGNKDCLAKIGQEFPAKPWIYLFHNHNKHGDCNAEVEKDGDKGPVNRLSRYVIDTNSMKIDPNSELFHGVGCEDCNGSGMRGRKGIFELLRVNEPLRKLIAGSPTTEEIKDAAGEDNISMRHDGIEKILAGITTAEEVLRVTQGIEED